MIIGKKDGEDGSYFKITGDEFKELETGLDQVKIASDRFGDYKFTLSLEIKNLRDKDYKKIVPGDNVIMPDPVEGDAWQQGNFQAQVEELKSTRLITVYDQDGNAWDVDPTRVENTSVLVE